MFNELRTKTAASYCSLIKGMAKYGDVQSATNLYDQMKKYNLSPDLNTINSMISLIKLNEELTIEKKIELMMQKLNEIKNYGLMPTLRTFNICFDLIKSFYFFFESIPLTLNLYKEMQNLKIEPSLATLSHFILIFYPSRESNNSTGVFKQVIDKVESMANSPNGIQWRDIDDGDFFRIAMEKLHDGGSNNLSLVL